MEGDTNLDGTVNVVDLNNMALNWRKSGGTWGASDLNADNIVDSGDLNLLALQWNNSIAMAAAVLEPATVCLAILFLTMMTLSRRRCLHV